MAQKIVNIKHWNIETINLANHNELNFEHSLLETKNAYDFQIYFFENVIN